MRITKPGRKSLIAAAIVVGAGAITAVASSRYRIGEAQFLSLSDHSEEGIIVRLYGVTFWAPTEFRSTFEAARDTSHLVPYRVDTWRRRHGLPVGTIGVSYGAPKQVAAQA